MDELFRRSEAIERAAWIDLYHATSAELRNRLCLETVELAGGTLLSARGVDHPLFNRAIGLRPALESQRAVAKTVVRHFGDREIRRFWIHVASDQRCSGLPECLEEEGVVRYSRSWMKFTHRATRMAAEKATPPVHAATEADRADVSALLCRGFSIPDIASPPIAAALGRSGWHFFVVRRGGAIVAAAALYVRGDDGYLAFAGSDPTVHTNGCQRALMRARIDLSAQLGCKRIFTETGVARESSASFRNMLRLGFDELCVRDNFAPRGAQWSSLPSSDANARSRASAGPFETPAKDAALSGS